MRSKGVLSILSGLLLAATLVAGINGKFYPKIDETYLIATKNVLNNSKLLPHNHHWHIVYNLDGVFIGKSTRDTMPQAVYFTQSCPLVNPIDSLLRLYFKSTRGNTKAAFLLTMDNTCTIRTLFKFEFRTLPSPLKEINIFPLHNLVQDEIYFDLNLDKVKVDSEMKDFLFFEYLLQQFLTKKILPDKIYAESIFSALATTYRPIYAPEVHFYLEPRAANVLIRKWAKIKRAFNRRLEKEDLAVTYRLFIGQLHLLSESSHSKIVTWAKLMQRYGFHKSIYSLFKEENMNSPILRERLKKFTDQIQLIWFCSSKIDKDLIQEMDRQKLDGKFRVFIQE